MELNCLLYYLRVYHAVMPASANLLLSRMYASGIGSVCFYSPLDEQPALGPLCHIEFIASWLKGAPYDNIGLVYI
jgi:hypothetical protein